MNSESAIVTIVGIIMFAVGLGFHYGSLSLVVIIVGGGITALGLFDGMMKYLNHS